MIKIDDEDEEDDIGRRVTRKINTGSDKCQKDAKGPMDELVMHPLEKVVQLRKMKQTTKRDEYKFRS